MTHDNMLIHCCCNAHKILNINIDVIIKNVLLIFSYIRRYVRVRVKGVVVMIKVK